MFKRRVKSDYSLAQRQEGECIYRCLTCPSGCPPTNINFCSFALCTITLNRSSLFYLDIRLKNEVVSSGLTFCMEKSVFTPSLLPPVRVHFSFPVVSDTLENTGPKAVLRGPSDTKRHQHSAKGSGTLERAWPVLFGSGPDVTVGADVRMKPLHCQSSSHPLTSLLTSECHSWASKASEPLWHIHIQISYSQQSPRSSGQRFRWEMTDLLCTLCAPSPPVQSISSTSYPELLICFFISQ